MFKLIKITFIVFCILTTTVAFGKSSQYFENTLVHMFSSECNKKCREEIIKSETDFAVILLLKVVSQNLQQQLQYSPMKTIVLTEQNKLKKMEK